MALMTWIKSRLFPNELVATRRGSPLLIGISSSSKLNTDHIPILYSSGKSIFEIFILVKIIAELTKLSGCNKPTSSKSPIIRMFSLQCLCFLSYHVTWQCMISP